MSKRSSMKSSKKNDYLSWSDYFMYNAILASKRSKDPSTQVGACIADKSNRIISIGYNGFPRGCHDDIFPWNKDSDNVLDNKYMYVVHAEINAIHNKNCIDLHDSIIYITHHPCNECAKSIIQSGIRHIYYLNETRLFLQFTNCRHFHRFTILHMTTR